MKLPARVRPALGLHLGPASYETFRPGDPLQRTLGIPKTRNKKTRCLLLWTLPVKWSCTPSSRTHSKYGARRWEGTRLAPPYLSPLRSGSSWCSCASHVCLGRAQHLDVPRNPVLCPLLRLASPQPCRRQERSSPMECTQVPSRERSEAYVRLLILPLQMLTYGIAV